MSDTTQAQLEKEALQYDEGALLNLKAKREKNIKLFEKAIEDERKEIAKEQQMLTIIRIKKS